MAIKSRPVYGDTTITCRNCGTLTAISNRTLEAVTEHKCPNCNMRMTDREMARMKMHLYSLWTELYDTLFGPTVELFSYNINLHPHYEVYEAGVEESEENGNQEGG